MTDARRALIERCRYLWDFRRFTAVEIATEMRISKNSVIGMGRRYGFAERQNPIGVGRISREVGDVPVVTGRASGAWSADEERILRESIATGRSDRQIADKLKRTCDAVSARLRKLGLRGVRLRRKPAAIPVRRTIKLAVVRAAPAPAKCSASIFPVASEAATRPTPIAATRFTCLAPGEYPAEGGCQFIVSADRPWQFCAEPIEIVVRDGERVRLPWCAGHRACVRVQTDRQEVAA